MRTNINPETILKELHSDYDHPDLIDRQIEAVEDYIDHWTERTLQVNRKRPVPFAYLKNAMESACISHVDDRVILYVLAKRDYKIGGTYGDYVANLKFSDEAVKDAQAMKTSGTFKIYPLEYEKLCLQERWKDLLDSKAEKGNEVKISGLIGN